jgi:hypothetical protein
MRRGGAPSGMLRSFGPVTSGELLPNTSAKGRAKPALRLLAFPFEVGIRHDSGTFKATHLAGIVFLFRDIIGDYATVGTGAWPIRWRKLWMDI